MTVRYLAFAGLLMALVSTMSCKDTPLVAGEGGEITVRADPPSVHIDDVPPASETTGTTTIRAQLFTAEGFPLEDAAVFFSADGGTLASDGGPVLTDSNGRAEDVLTVTVGDDDTVEVTARSGVATATANVNVDLESRNDLPTVTSITAVPANSQLEDSPVTFAGNTSDPENDPITCWRWEIGSTPAVANPIQVGTDLSEITQTFTEPGSVTVRLRVSDLPSIACTTSTPLTAFGPATVLNYTIRCGDTTAPVAEAGSVTSPVAVNTAVQLNGNGSTDPQSGIETYQWACGTDGTAVPSGATSQATATCTYTTIGIKTITLTVTNGCGLIDTDTVQVTVN